MSNSIRQAYWAARRFFGSRQLLFFAADLATAAQAAPVGHVRDRASPAMLAAIAAARGDAVADYTARLANGHLLLHTGSAPDAWGWLTVTGDAATTVPWEGGAALLIPPRSAYFWDYFTLSSARGKGLYPALLRDGMAHAAHIGARRGSIYCDAANIASRKGILAAGFSPPANVGLLRLGPLLITTGRCGRHVSLGAAGVPIDPLLPSP